jgi:hypothetical protein
MLTALRSATSFDCFKGYTACPYLNLWGNDMAAQHALPNLSNLYLLLMNDFPQP